MNREQAKKLVKIIDLAYPNYYKDKTKEKMSEIINFWQWNFNDTEEPIVALALRNHIKSNKFPPTVADIVEEVENLTENSNEIELWNIAVKAIKKGSVMTRDEFKQLPEPLQLWFGNVAQVKELAMVSPEVINTVVKGQFLKTAHRATKTIKARETITGGTKTSLKSNLSLTGGYKDEQ